MGAEEGMESNPKTFVEEEEEDEDDDEGPPPGFDSIAIRSQLENMDVEDEDEDDDDDDGPPPGFAEPHQPETPPLSATSHSDTQRLRNQGLSDVEIGKKQNETKYEEDRPPLGSQSTSPKQPHQSMTSSELVSDTQMRSIEEDDDGPPPGWQWNPQQQPLPESIPPPGLQSAPSSSIQTGIIQEDDDGPPPGWQLISSQQRQPQTIPSLLPQSVAPSDIEKENKGGNKGEIEWRQSGSESSPMPEYSSTPTRHSSVASSDIEMATKQQSIKNEEKKLRTDRGPSQRIISRLPPAALQISSEVGQLVCGTCRQLLSYPRGSKWVQCSACQTVNLALEGHQIGQVKCGGCTVLLMYPYGAPSVKCSSCHFVTRIGAHNRRPHLAAQQARRQRPSHQAH
ncbi:PREDICTED: protein IWS1 homolog isoform X1 [Ipomoea nil]|uniref:protein IWS1 homolog isoform X1 n=1 Tax=Ipomoea nil TaxID=35883 RepID=UPI000901E6CC|nr:PREDICTED: protein IWS1 homolog isoform X1 [Ipomoea nil]